MGIDLSKLSPAPWTTAPCNVLPNLYLYGLQPPHQHEPDPPGLMKCHPPLVLRPDDAEFIALARNAFDVLVRRGWDIVRVSRGWIPAIPGGGPEWPQQWPDPYTALVAAEEWYVANVEGKP